MHSRFVVVGAIRARDGLEAAHNSVQGERAAPAICSGATQVVVLRAAGRATS